MSRSAIATSAKPRFIVPGMAALDPGVERYVVRGGGSAVFALERDDLLEIALLEGGQAVEIVAFGKGGKSDLAAIGLKGKGKPEGLQNILASGSDDAERVRFGLFRRGLDLGRASCAKLFGTGAPAAKPSTSRPSGPPSSSSRHRQPACSSGSRRHRPMSSYSSRARVRSPRANFAYPSRWPSRAWTSRSTSPARQLRSRRGEYIQIIDVAGRQCSDFLAFDRQRARQGRSARHRFDDDAHRIGPAYPTPGPAFEVLRPHYNPLVEVVQDTVGRHDTFNLACTARTYEDMGYFGHPNCSDNFNRALHPYGVEATPRLAGHQLLLQHQRRRRQRHLVRRAVVAARRLRADAGADRSRLRHVLLPLRHRPLQRLEPHGHPGPGLSQDRVVQTRDRNRMTPDAPLQLTRESGFHPRTSALTRAFGEYRGFWLPHQFTQGGAVEEYWACRERAVVMDLSPLRKLEVVGPDAEDLLQGIVPRDVRKLAVGQIVYTAMCYEHGGMVDDGTLFRLGAEQFPLDRRRRCRPAVDQGAGRRPGSRSSSRRRPTS